MGSAKRPCPLASEMTLTLMQGAAKSGYTGVRELTGRQRQPPGLGQPSASCALRSAWRSMRPAAKSGNSFSDGRRPNKGWGGTWCDRWRPNQATCCATGGGHIRRLVQPRPAARSDDCSSDGRMLASAAPACSLQSRPGRETRDKKA
jgi:hypothetical protein